MNFAELGLHPLLLGAIEKSGFTKATPVQAATIPHILDGRDVAGLAQTGTGKTAAFLLPLMERILRAGPADPAATPEQIETASKRAFADWRPGQFILILVPTRELAEQVYENAMKLKGDSHLRAVSIYGGVAYDKQKQGLRDGVEFVIATPGRLIDLFKEHLVDLKQVRGIVFDEADRMFDMGFKDDMKFILQRVPKERQFLVFSATLNMDVLSTAYQFGANPVDIDVSRDQAKAENVEDAILHVGSDEKGMYLLSLLKKHQPRQTIIFSNFKMNVPRVAQFLNDNKYSAAGISSLLTQAQRTRVMEQFKADNDRNILVATDVAARGLDIKGVDMVINFELPDDAENYVHRIGRTGRAGEKGKAFSLVSDRDVESLQRIEDYLRHKVNAIWMDDEDLVKEFKPMQSDRGDRRGPRPERGAGGGRDGGRDGGRRDGGRGGRDRGRGGDRPVPHAAAGEGSPRPERSSEGGGRRRGGRGRDRDRQRQPQQAGEAGGENQANAQQPAGQPGEPRPQHRDRMSGRHRGDGRQDQQGRGDRLQGERHQGERNQGGRGRDRDRGGRRGEQQARDGQRGEQRGGNGRDRNQPGPRRDPQSKGPVPNPKPAEAGFGKKVSSFFKKLFGQKTQ